MADEESRPAMDSAGTPGPNKYMLPPLLGPTNHDPRRRIEPAFSMQGRRPPDRVVEQPGPNKFQTGGLTRYGNDASGRIDPTMKGRIPPIAARPIPGPKYNTPDTNLTMPQAPAFYLSRRIKTVPPTAGVPGPNSYGLPTYIDGTGQVPTARSSPAYKLHDRVPPPGALELRPGPLAYGVSPLECYKVNYPPQFTMAGRISRKEPISGPGPNKYDSNVNPIGKSGPAFTLASRYRPRVGILRTEADNAPAFLICDSG